MVDYSFGPLIDEDGVLFRFWAPLSDAVTLEVEGMPAVAMEGDGHGWFQCRMPGVKPGARYAFQLPDGLRVPDPASRHQPDDVFGLSEVVDLTRVRPSAATPWPGRSWHELVLYELHVGTFTEEGTFLAAIDKLDHLAALGITAIELMPIADFPGHRNWGYDGVLFYAPESRYGRPEDLQELVSQAHARGISVILDVVYNHFGPSGNFLPSYAPIFTSRHQNPWGEGINLDDQESAAVRTFLIENAVYWLDQYALDGLRLDAVHVIKDDSETHLLDELVQRVRSTFPDRHIHLILENDDNNPDLLERQQAPQAALYNAQWNDDFHHALHAATTGETVRYYGDYLPADEKLAKALAEGFVYQGEYMSHRDRHRGAPSRHLAPTAFVTFLHNHDHIGNRANGVRVMADLPEQTLLFASTLLLLSPQIPMLFMGEEWCAKTPFPYFCDFDAELNEQVRKGRDEEVLAPPDFDPKRWLDPADEEAFRSAILDWTAATAEAGAAWIDHYRQLISLRRDKVTPLLERMTAAGFHRVENGLLHVSWPLDDGRSYRLVANPSAHIVMGEADIKDAEIIYRLGDHQPNRLAPWSLVFSVSRSG